MNVPYKSSVIFLIFIFVKKSSKLSPNLFPKSQQLQILLGIQPDMILVGFN